MATNMTILSIGVRPENQLAKEAGLELGARGHIVVTNFYKRHRKIFTQSAMRLKLLIISMVKKQRLLWQALQTAKDALPLRI